MPAVMPRKRPVVVLNDKRYHQGGKLLKDKRIILDIEHLAARITDAYPQADVMVVRLRDMPMVEQLLIMSAAQVYITTAGSSSHLAVFMPRGSHVILLGGPETAKDKEIPWGQYTSFNELDRWFPLTYVQFHRYVTNINDTSSYTIEPMPGAWQPREHLRSRWHRYNANIRVQMHRLQPMLDQALGV
jgi:hypothetical protein